MNRVEAAVARQFGENGASPLNGAVLAVAPNSCVTCQVYIWQAQAVEREFNGRFYRRETPSISGSNLGQLSVDSLLGLYASETFG